MPFYSNLLDMIGNTPLVEAKHLDTGCCRLFLKLENYNPGGSIKDRPSLAMVVAAEKAGKIKPGGTLIEATAGNTGLGLALIATVRGYKLKLVIPDKMSQEKISHLSAMGADIIIARSDVTKAHPDYYQNIAARLAESMDNAFYVNQFINTANVQAHEEGTAPEIWQQMNQELDAIVCGVGTGGTLTGLGRYFRKVAPKVEIVLADPEGSILTDYINTGCLKEAGRWLVEGIGEDFIPDICDLSFVKTAYTIPDKEAFLTARMLLAKEAILAGTSSGTLLAAALRYCQAQKAPKRVVTLIPDSGNKYLSKLYNDNWMREQGFL
jgi:cystathionine beta-synthase